MLGLCTLLNLSADQRPPVIDAGSSQFLPNILHVLNALKESYAAKRELESTFGALFIVRFALCVKVCTMKILERVWVML